MFIVDSLSLIFIHGNYIGLCKICPWSMTLIVAPAQEFGGLLSPRLWVLGVKTFIIIPKKRGLKRPPNSYTGARMRVAAHGQILQTPTQFQFLQNIKYSQTFRIRLYLSNYIFGCILCFVKTEIVQEFVKFARGPRLSFQLLHRNLGVF